VTTDGARDVYGVVVEPGPDGDGATVNAAATTAERDRQRLARQARSRLTGDRHGRADLGSARRLDDNLVQATGGDGASVVACRHCGEILGDSGPDASLTAALYEGPPAEAGPQIIANAADYVDAPVVFRQFSCPGCWTALYSGVVPATDGTPVTIPLAGGLVTV
jgi:N-methylhydantoinase B